MRKISVDAIKGNEKLAKSIYLDSDVVLISEGTIIRESYIPKFKDLKIRYIYVEDEISQGIKDEEITEDQIKEQCQDIVQNTIKRYAYSGNTEFQVLEDVAKEIIDDMVRQPEVMFNISGVRQKSEQIYAHSLNVCALSVLLALRMGLSKKQVDAIAVGSMLHDIGYCNVPVEIKNTNYKEYTHKDIKAMKMHVIHGYTIIEHEKWLKQSSKDIILYHHERIDGSGYPIKITGEKMNIGVKIVAICDEFDNLIYGNFTEAMKVHEAMEAIVAMGGQKFDMEVVKLFNESVAAYPIGTIVKTSDNEIGIVLRQNNKCPTRPVIRILEDKNGESITEWIERDLTSELTLFIKDTLENY